MSFAKHLFISYAHIDNDVAQSVPRGWVDHLQENLQLRLAQLLGYRPVVWRDKAELKGNYIFRDTIAIGLTETGVFLSVLSPRYLESQSCRDELEGFLNAAPRNGGLWIGDRHRIFKVIKTPVDFNLHPEAIRDLLGYEFYAQDPITKRFREFDHEIGPKGEKDKRYWERLDDLAQDICALLKELLGAPAPKPGETIFLAETTSDLAEQRDKVRRELQLFGHITLPDKPLPRCAPELQSAVRDYLQRSRLSVHLIGAHYDLVIWLQEELARERHNSTAFSRLIWLPPDLEPKDERQRRFIETLQNSFQAANGSDLIQSRIEDLKTIIQEKLRTPPAPVASEKRDDGLKRVYLVCDQRDLDDIGELYSFLYEAGCEVLLPEFDENTMQADKQHMLDCDAALFFYASLPEMWVRTRLRGLTGFGRTRPLAAAGVYVTGAETPQKKLFLTREALVMKNFGAFDAAVLQPFMQKL
jgi:hypothetical protein